MCDEPAVSLCVECEAPDRQGFLCVTCAELDRCGEAWAGLERWATGRRAPG